MTLLEQTQRNIRGDEMKGTPTQKLGNVARQIKNGTKDKSGDGADLPKVYPAQEEVIRVKA